VETQFHELQTTAVLNPLFLRLCRLYMFCPCGITISVTLQGCSLGLETVSRRFLNVSVWSRSRHHTSHLQTCHPMIR